MITACSVRLPLVQRLAGETMTDLEKLTHKRINLVARENTMRLSFLEVIFFIILFVLIAVFAKFGVYDPLYSSAHSSGAVIEAQKELDALLASNAEMSDLRDEYERYVVEGMTDEERALVGRDEVIEMVREQAMGVGSLASVTVKGNVVTITFSGVDLQTISALAERVESDSRVDSVSISNAEDRESTSPTATISITMKSPAELEENGAESSGGANGTALASAAPSSAGSGTGAEGGSNGQ